MASSGHIQPLRHLFGTLYGSAQWRGLNLRIGASLAAHDVDVSRRVTFPGFADATTASYDGWTAQAFGEVGYRVAFGNLTVEPFAGAAGLRLHTGGFVEEGGAAALIGSAQDHELATTTLGVRAEAQLGDALPLTLRGLLGWRRAYGDVKPEALLALAGGAAEAPIVEATFPPPTAPLIRKLESSFTLTDEERRALESLSMQVQAIRADQDLVREGDRPSRSFVVLEGYASTYKVTGEGKRQIQSWHIPGDIPDLQSLHLRVLDISITTLTPSRVGFIPHEVLRDLCRRYPRLNDAFWRETLIYAAIFREWMSNIGRREAYSRMAHLLCEWIVRLRAVGLAEDHNCDFPMTQQELADATGNSTVHVNRVLQELRKDGLIELKGNKLNVLDWERLKQGDFDPMYLHLDPREAA